jgi:catechol 2,3-dioxygenase-like lactoylglutathione lyase family enzyme
VSDRFSPPKIAQIELHCDDLAAAEAFYCGVLGLGKVSSSATASSCGAAR